MAAACAAACAGVAGEARANGRFPTAQHVVVGPGPASDVIALRTTFGVLLSRDGGRTFGWLCEEGMYFPLVPSINFDAPIELSASGSVVFGFEDGIRHTADACGATDVAGTTGHVFIDLTSDPAGRVLYAIEGAAGVANAVYRGDGETFAFTRQGAGLRNVLFDTIEVAPSDPTRLYVTGRDTETFAPIFYRSDDSGATLTPVTPDAGAADSLWVSGVDPTAPDTLYVRAAMGLGTELRRSRDGGRSFRRVATTPDPMLGFAISDDGRTIWVGSIEAGLLRSDDGGDSFHQVNRVPVLCLRQHAGVLWACSDWVNQPFALGRSRDRGESFEPVLHFSNFDQFVGPPRCATRSEGADVCVERWPMLQRSLEAPEPDAGVTPPPDGGRRDAGADVPRDAPAPSADGALDATPDAGAPPPGNGTCNCDAVGASAPGRSVALAAVALAAALRRRARNRVAPASR